MMDFFYHLDTNQPLVLCINAVLCFTMMGICICRLNAMGKDVLFRVQLEYVFYMGAGFISMARPWWGENVGWASLMLECAILASFLSSSHAWKSVHTSRGERDTAPENANSEHMPLELTR